MGEGESDGRIDLVRRVGKDSHHRLRDHGLFVDDGVDLRELALRFLGRQRLLAWHEILRNDQPAHFLAGEENPDAGPRNDIVCMRSRNPIVEETIDRHGQGHAHDARVCGIVRSNRR